MSKIAFLFPGQGAQAVGMCRELEAELPAVKSLFDRANAVLGFDLRAICFDGPAEALEATDVSQPAIFVASLAALESLKQTNPDVVRDCQGAAGLSLGEYTALVVRRGAGLRVGPGSRPPPRPGDAGRRGRLPQRHDDRAGPGRGQGRRTLPPRRPPRPALEGQHARPRQHRRLGRRLGSRTRRADRPGAGRDEVHPTGRRRRLPHPAHEAGRRTARRGPRPGRRPQPPASPSTPTSTPPPTTTPPTIRKILVTQVLQGVRWDDSMRRMLADGFDTFYEIGPGRVLTGLLKRIDRKTPCTSVPAR